MPPALLKSFAKQSRIEFLRNKKMQFSQKEKQKDLEYSIFFSARCKLISTTTIFVIIPADWEIYVGKDIYVDITENTIPKIIRNVSLSYLPHKRFHTICRINLQREVF